ncbi:hypothetical protein JL721_6869 [Aureococcus anophagefferens]|nr:hypothetical protein JL721_6869 [Aureococcus anophagefferens]
MCGNLGLLLVGHDGDAAPEALLEEMARVVAMRGAQSYGFVAAAGGKSMTMHKAVLTKRDDIATALRRAVRRRVGARALGTRPLLLAAHRRDVLEVGRRRCFGCDLPVMALDALRAWLAVRLGRAPPSTGDSCVASGALELLFAAGDCAAAARLALALDDARAGDVALRSAVAAALRRVLDELRDPARAFASSGAKARAVGGSRNCCPRLRSTRERAAVAEAALRGYSEWDLRSAVWRFLKTAHGAFGLCATTSLAPGAVVLGSVKQPLIVGVGRGFVAYASERAAVHVGAIGAALKYRYVLAKGDVVSVAPEATVQGTLGGSGCRLALARVDADAAVFRDLGFRLDTSPNAAAARAFAEAVFDADRMRRSSLDVVVVAVEASLGQTFPTLNAARALRDAGADVFVVAGSLDVQLAEVVKGGQSFGRARRSACSCGYRSPAVAALDALLYAFFPVVAALVLRFVQKRTMLARFGRRTIMVLDVPMVHQCAVAFGQKLFGLSYGLNGVDFAGANQRTSSGGSSRANFQILGRIDSADFWTGRSLSSSSRSSFDSHAGANPADHGVHRMLHRVVRGTLVALGVPDGRLKALVDVECAAYLTALQLKSLSNWGVGAELATVGHHSSCPASSTPLIFDAFQRPVFLSEVHHASPRAPDARRLSFLEAPEAGSAPSAPASSARRRAADQRALLAAHAVVETLYEGRVASLERLVAFYAAQAGARVATTPAPASPAAPVDGGRPRDDLERVATTDQFLASLDASQRGSGGWLNRALDASQRGSGGWLNRPARSRTASDEKGLDDSRRSWRDLARASRPRSASRTVSAPKRAAAARLPHVDAAAGPGRAQDDRRWRGPQAAPSAMARATVALTPQIQKRMDVLSKVFEGWEEDCMNCKAFAASLADWTTPKGAEVIREGEDAAQPAIDLRVRRGGLCRDDGEVRRQKQKRVARLVAPFYVGEGQIEIRAFERAPASCIRDDFRETLTAKTDEKSLPTRVVGAPTPSDGLFFGNIDNAAFFAAFEAFAKRTFCAENVVFLRGYRDLQTETDAAAAVARVERLFRDHVDVDASDADNLAVNVSQKVVRESKKNFAAAREADDVAALRTVFDKCAEEINQMLTKDIIPTSERRRAPRLPARRLAAPEAAAEAPVDGVRTHVMLPLREAPKVASRGGAQVS